MYGLMNVVLVVSILTFREEYLSYPSGHTTTAVFLAAILSVHFPRAWFLWWGLAVGCMMDRLESAQHYPSDVLAGIAVGLMVALYMSRAGWPAKLAARLACMGL